MILRKEAIQVIKDLTQFKDISLIIPAHYFILDNDEFNKDLLYSLISATKELSKPLIITQSDILKEEIIDGININYPNVFFIESMNELDKILRNHFEK